MAPGSVRILGADRLHRRGGDLDASSYFSRHHQRVVIAQPCGWPLDSAGRELAVAAYHVGGRLRLTSSSDRRRLDQSSSQEKLYIGVRA